MSRTITIGLMSGTSLDGADAVAMAFEDGSMSRLGHAYLPFPQTLRSALMALTSAGPDEIERMGDASVALARHYAAAVEKLLAESGIGRGAVAAIGAHGQTVRHRPERGFTLQINHPALLAELTGIDVICDFRSRDVAAGGEGAPLVPAFHAECFSGPRPRAIVNVGGIANVSALPAKGDAGSTVTGGDTGPGNMLLDAWCAKAIGRPYDRNGDWARTGRTVPELLADFLSDPYFARPFPKSTGRELFSAAWLERHLARFPGIAPEDAARTITELTAVSIADGVRALLPDAAELVLCGGGAFNATLREAIAAHTQARVTDTAEFGVHPMEVEGAAFAWLAARFLERLPGNLPAVTRARGPRILGALYPH